MPRCLASAFDAALIFRTCIKAMRHQAQRVSIAVAVAVGGNDANEKPPAAETGRCAPLEKTFPFRLLLLFGLF